jgi:hypothetical protein
MIRNQPDASPNVFFVFIWIIRIKTKRFVFVIGKFCWSEYCQLMIAALRWELTQRKMVVADVSGQSVCSIFKCQEVQKLRNIPDERWIIEPTDATVIISIFLELNQINLNMFRASLCPSSGGQERDWLKLYVKMHGCLSGGGVHPEPSTQAAMHLHIKF